MYWQMAFWYAALIAVLIHLFVDVDLKSKFMYMLS